jgi:hypothetical protein
MHRFQNELAYFGFGKSYEPEILLKTTPGTNVIKLFMSVIFNFCTKLQHLYE